MLKLHFKPFEHFHEGFYEETIFVNEFIDLIVQKYSASVATLNKLFIGLTSFIC